MKVYVRKVAVYTIATIFLLLGFVGLVLPLVPQLIFFALGLILLSFEIPWLAGKIESILKRFPKAHALYIKHRGYVEKYFR